MKFLYATIAAALCGIFSISAQTETGNHGMPSKGTRIIERAVPDRNVKSDLPNAVIYSMNGDWAQYVPVTLTADGTGLVSFPAPSDLTDSQTPVSLGDGMWLDRRGVNRHTAFTRWTYAEYSSLPAVPSPEEILSNIIPGAKVTELIALPIPVTEASRNPEAVRRLVAEGLKGATIIYRLPGSGKANIQNSPSVIRPEKTDRGEPGPRPTLLTSDPVCK